MKINWGFGILVFILIFMAFILSLVYKCSKQKVDLVSEKYYEQELMYQDQVNKINNTTALHEKLQVLSRRETAMLEIRYPSKTDLPSLSGNVNFFKPDNASLDFNIPVKSTKEYEQEIPVSSLKKGWWNIRINWASSGTPYYYEQKVLIQ